MPLWSRKLKRISPFWILFFNVTQKQHLTIKWPSGWSLGLAIFLLPVLTLCKTFAWYKITQALGIAISGTETLLACLMSIAGRYIPGKVLFVLGRIEAYGPEAHRLSTASFGMIIEFMVENFAGFALLLCTAILGFCPEGTGIYCGVFSSGVLILIFFSSLLRYPLKFLPQRFQPQTNIDLGSIRLIFVPLFFTLLHWAVYLFLIYMLMGQTLNLNPLQMVAIGAALSFSSTLGTLSLLTPGGLGVRESLATMLFSTLGLSPEAAFGLAMVARLIQWASEISLAVPTLIYQLSSKKLLR
jgi:uncharacterized membrane protein YbhN (UPF0104 family)